MGKVFDFIRDSGKALGFGSDWQPPDTRVLERELDDLELASDRVEVEVIGDTAIIRGEVPSQDLLERLIVAAGNIKGIARVEADVDVPVERETRFYTVKEGDTLWRIAEIHYGHGQGGSFEIILEANRPVLAGPEDIYPGQVLRIP